MSLKNRIDNALGHEALPLIGFLLFVVVVFSLAMPLFLTGRNLGSMAFQVPVLGLLTLAMMVPILSGGLNLAIIYTANLSGLTFPAMRLTRFATGMHDGSMT